MSTENQLVLIPFPVMSHLVSALETAKLLVERDPTLSITVIVLRLPIDTKIDHSIKNSRNSRIHFINISQSNELVLQLSNVHHFVDSQKDRVRDHVAELMKSQGSVRVAGLVIDMFCTCMIDVANELGIPSFVYFATGASPLGLFFHLQSLVDEHNKDVNEWVGILHAELSVPAFIHPVPVTVIPSPILENGDEYLNIPRRFRETKGILINTFRELEHHAISVLKDDEGIPPVYPIGPVLQDQGDENSKIHDEIFEWLGGQPDSSVVFLCFGCHGYFEGDQVKEIAFALEHSGHRFLWSLRKPSPKNKLEFPGEYENPEKVLPEGFLERTAGTGMVIGWAPQIAVLSHPATGGFVSHCGWNSTLESITCGVPIAAWPFESEQQANAFFLVKELGMAVEIQMDYKQESDVIVGSDKIGSAIRELMDPENPIRAKVKVMQKKSKAALVEGGSSYDALACFLEDIKH